MTHKEIKGARIKLALTQVQFAKLLAVDVKTYRRWEAGTDTAYGCPVPPTVAVVIGWIIDEGFRPSALQALG